MSPRNAGGGAKSAQSGTAGIIPVNPAVLQPPAAKSSTRLKVVVRRLPPSLTKDEFDQAFGDEWRVGAGRVDWIEYRQGKVRSPGKLPEQSRAYLHLTAEKHLQAFESKFLSITFRDAKGSYRHPDLKHLPPALEFAPFQRVPPARSRQDNRQGLIDQDPEYMAFLEGETQVLPKPPSLDATTTDRSKGAITSTPLIEALREKKAAKAKVAAAKAATKRPDEAISPSKTKPAVANKGSKAASVEPKSSSKSDTKNKETARPSTKDSKPTMEKAPSVPTAAASASGKTKRERAPASIKSMLERDLGINQPPRRGPKVGATTNDSVKTPPVTITVNNASEHKGGRSSKRDKDTATVGAAPHPTKTSPAPPSAPSPRPPKSKSPAIPADKTPAQAKPNSPLAIVNPASRQNKSPSKPNASSTKAYLKHANASQGITDELLRQALGQFGDLVSLEIDKRKGTALAEFKSNNGLAAAMAKRSVPVAQGAVEVLEYRDKPQGSNNKPSGGPGRSNPRGARGRGGRGANSERPGAANVPATDSGAG